MWTNFSDIFECFIFKYLMNSACYINYSIAHIECDQCHGSFQYIFCPPGKFFSEKAEISGHFNFN